MNLCKREDKREGVMPPTKTSGATAVVSAGLPSERACTMPMYASAPLARSHQVKTAAQARTTRDVGQATCGRPSERSPVDSGCFCGGLAQVRIRYLWLAQREGYNEDDGRHESVIRDHDLSNEQLRLF